MHIASQTHSIHTNPQKTAKKIFPAVTSKASNFENHCPRQHNFTFFGQPTLIHYIDNGNLYILFKQFPLIIPSIKLKHHQPRPIISSIKIVVIPISLQQNNLRINSMKQSIQANCNCYGPILIHQQKFFLTKKRDPEEPEPLPSSRRINKSTGNKNESENKTHKKSLKKRPGSSTSIEQSTPVTPIDSLRHEPEFKQKFSEQAHLKSRSFLIKHSETPVATQNTQVTQHHSIKFPETASHVRQPNPYNHKQWTYVTAQQPIVPQHYAYVPTQLSHEKHPAQLRPQLQQLRNDSTQFLLQNSFASHPQIKGVPLHQMKGKQVLSKETLVSRQAYYSMAQPQHRPYKSDPRVETEHTTINEQDLMIEGFQKLLGNQDEKNGQVFLKDQKHHHPREVQKSKRLEKQQQQLFGRFAQSDDGEDNDSESPPSEVIGRGFDKTYQEQFLQAQTYGANETKASRSTNTKLSQLPYGQKRLSCQPAKTTFDTPNHFKSYKFL